MSSQSEITYRHTPTLQDRAKQARKGRLIAEANDFELSQAIAFVSMLGNYLMPTQEQDAILKGFLRTNFPLITCEEIGLAFEMAVTGEMKIDLKFVRGGTLSAVEFGQVLNRYKDHRLNYLNSPTMTPALPEKVLTEDDKRNLSVQYTTEIFNRFITGKPTHLHWSHFKFLQRDRRIRFEGDQIVADFGGQYLPIGTVSDVQRRAIEALGDEIRRRELSAINRTDKLTAKREMERFLDGQNEQTEKDRAREITLGLYFTALKEKGIHISEILKRTDK